MKLGFIGMGNMAQALAGGFIAAKKIEPSDIYAFAPNQKKLLQNAESLGFTPVDSLKKLASSEDIDIFVMACKPYQIESVLAECGKDLLCAMQKGSSLVSVAAGWDYDAYEKAFSSYGKNPKVQFVMPNTPAMVGEGVFLFEKKNSLDADVRKTVEELFSSLGLVKELPSSLMGIGGAVTGCGPAFVDLFMEAYADAAVKYGISRADAYELVAQTVLGSAALCLKTGQHPAVLKDAVCSPNGTTICGVAALEKEGFRNACISSIDAIMLKKKCL